MFSKRWLKIVSVAAALLFSAQTSFAFSANDFLKAKSTNESAEKNDEIKNKMWSYGFTSEAGANFVHDKILVPRMKEAFNNGTATVIFGHTAQKSDSKESNLLRRIFGFAINGERPGMIDLTSAHISIMLAEIAAIDEKTVEEETKRVIDKKTGKTLANPKALPFLREVKRIARIEDDKERIDAAIKLFAEDTRFVAFEFGENGLDPYLYNVGDITSEEHRAIVAHTGTFAYEGSEGIKGGPRTIYLSGARIRGFADKGYEGVDAFRDLLKHEFKDMARGRHVDESPEVTARINKVNQEIDQEYISATLNKEGTGGDSILVYAKGVDIEKYQYEGDLGKRVTFAIMGKSKVHPEILKGSGKKVTVSVMKADVGSTGGHGTAPGHMLEAVADVWAKAAAEGKILDFFITRVGDDISVTVTHTKGKDDKDIHGLGWNGFLNGAVVAKDMGYYGAGQDLLTDSFSGNLKGAGPSWAEMEFAESPSEVLIIGQADKTGPGAFSKGLLDIFMGPKSSWQHLAGDEVKTVKIGVVDFDYNDKVGRHGWFSLKDYTDLYFYTGDPNRYSITGIVIGDKGEDTAAVTAQRLHNIGGVYTGKDDPMFIARSQKRFPAVGDFPRAFLDETYIVPGWMRGSHNGPLFPVSLKDSKIGILDGPPLLSMWSFNLNNGRLVGFYDLMAANPAIRRIQDKRTELALDMMAQGFREPARLPQTEIEYQDGLKKLEARSDANWTPYEPEKPETPETPTASKTQEAPKNVESVIADVSPASTPENKVMAKDAVSPEREQVFASLRDLISNGDEVFSSEYDKLSKEKDLSVFRWGEPNDKEEPVALAIDAKALFEMGLAPLISNRANRLGSDRMIIVAILQEGDTQQAEAWKALNASILNGNAVRRAYSLDNAISELKADQKIKNITYIGTDKEAEKYKAAGIEVIIVQKILDALNRIESLGAVLKGFVEEYEKYKLLGIQA